MVRVFKSAGLLVDPSLGEIRRNGESLSAERKVFELLVLLLEADGQVVEQGEIQERLWPDVRVSRDALYRVIKEARALVGDSGDRQLLIRTVPGRGIRWIPPIEVGAPEPSRMDSALASIRDLLRAGRFLDARTRALECARDEAPDSTPRHRAEALVLFGALVLHGRVDRDWMDLTRRVLNQLDASDHELRAALLGRQSHQLYWSKDPARSRQALTEARQAALEGGSQSALAWVEMGEHSLHPGPEHFETRRGHAERALAHALAGDEPQTRAWAHEQVAHNAMELGDIDTVEAHAQAVELLDEDHPLIWPGRIRTMLQLHHGDLPAAERALLRELQKWGSDASAQVFQYIGAPLLWLRFEQERLPEMLPLLRQFVAAGGDLPVWRLSLARAELESGNLEGARSEYEGILAVGLDEADHDFLSPLTLAHAAVLCAAFEDRPRIAWLEKALLPYQGRLLVAPRANFSLGPVDLILSQLAATDGRPADAERHRLRGLELALQTRSAPSVRRAEQLSAAGPRVAIDDPT